MALLDTRVASKRLVDEIKVPMVQSVRVKIITEKKSSKVKSA